MELVSHYFFSMTNEKKKSLTNLLITNQKQGFHELITKKLSFVADANFL